MRRCALLALSLMGMIVLTGCQSKADMLAKRHIADLNELADALESRADGMEILERLHEVGETGGALRQMRLSDEEEMRLKGKYGKDLNVARGRVNKAIRTTMPAGDQAKFMQVMVACMSM